MKITSIIVASASLSCIFCSAAFAHDELLLGRSETNQILFDETYHEPLHLDMVFPGIPGLAGAPIGLTHLAGDEPGFLTLPAGVNLGFVQTGADPGLTMYNGMVPMGNGDAFMLGAPFFHLHPVWGVENPVIDDVYSLFGFFRDFNGLLSDSGPIQIDFTPVPAPAACALLGAFGLASLRRRRA